MGIVFLFLICEFLSLGGTSVSNAQTSDTEYQKLLERDKNIPQIKIERAFAEARKIEDDILAVMSANKPKFQLKRTSARHLKHSDSPGRRGVTRNELSWQFNNTLLWMDVTLELSKESSLKLSRNGLQAISMGEFFDVPNIGDEATLVKNVVYNKEVTQVGLHFVKGRAKVSIYLMNHQRKTEKNEKELMEIVRLIEPLVVVRPNFDDL